MISSKKIAATYANAMKINNNFVQVRIAHLLSFYVKKISDLSRQLYPFSLSLSTP